MLRILSTSLLALLFASPLYAQVPATHLDSSGVLTLTATDDGCVFLLSRSSKFDLLHFDLGDGNGLQSRFFKIGVVKSVVFVGGDGHDMVWVQSPLPLTATSAGAFDQLIGAQFLPAGSFNEYFVDAGDVVTLKAGRDVVHGTGATLIYYP